jgi:GT2 family glycosyltransferase
MTNTMKISVVIPTYRRPQLLMRCLHALHKQTLDKKHFDIIVVSDGYDKTSEKLVKDMSVLFRERLTYLYTEVKKGPAAARNLGWLFSDSELIVFTDDDCIPDELWLQEIISAYEEDKREKIAFSGTLIVPTAQKPTDYERNIAQLENAEFITANCACTKRALYTVGGFDERFRMAWREDSDLHFKLLQNSIPIIKLKKAVVIHPVREANWGISLKEQKKGVYNALLFKKFPNLYRSRIANSAPPLYYVLLILLLSIPLLWTFNQNQLLEFVVFLWILLTVSFIIKRLKGTSKTFSHVSEMIITSLFIPYVSIYWQIYGAVKYKVFMV